MSDKCWCGHKKEDHENGTGNCKECDLQAGYGGNDSCSHFQPPIAPPPPRQKTLEERVQELEQQVRRLQSRTGVCR